MQGAERKASCDPRHRQNMCTPVGGMSGWMLWTTSDIQNSTCFCIIAFPAATRVGQDMWAS
jgi:hypothetical protein